MAAVRRLVHALDASGLFPIPAGELSVALLPPTEMARVHERFLGIPGPTDVITFEGDPLLGSAGEICVCPEIARDFAKSHRKDFATELALYLVHGCLHLAGLDDTSPAAKRAMRAAESKAMRHLAAENAVPPAEFPSA